MKKLISTTLALLGLALFTSCGDPNKNPEPPVNNGLQLVTSERYVKADGAASVKFTVMHNGADVTSTAKIVNYRADGSVTLSTPSFSTKEVGQHQFYAIHDGVSTEKIMISALTSIPNLPVDAMPDKYDAFKKRILAMQCTGTWCGYCPYVIKAMHDFSANDANASDVVFVSAHVSDQLTSTKSTALDQMYNQTGGWPALIFSMSAAKSDQHQSNVTPAIIRSVVDGFLKTRAAVGISVASSVVDGVISVRANVKVGSQGSYAIGALLLEDGQVATQLNADKISGDYFNIHNNIIRGGYPASNAYENLGGLKSVNGSVKYDFCCELNAKSCGVVDITKTRLVVFVYNVATALCDNAVVIKVGESLSFEYL